MYSNYAQLSALKCINDPVITHPQLEKLFHLSGKRFGIDRIKVVCQPPDFFNIRCATGRSSFVRSFSASAVNSTRYINYQSRPSRFATSWAEVVCAPSRRSADDSCNLRITSARSSNPVSESVRRAEIVSATTSRINALNSSTVISATVERVIGISRVLETRGVCQISGKFIPSCGGSG